MCVAMAFFALLMLVVYQMWERNLTNLRIFHFPSKVLGTRKLLTELFSKSGSRDGGGFTTIAVETLLFVCESTENGKEGN